MAKETKIICIMCPLACQVTLTIDDKGDIIGTANYLCKQGKKYAIAECKFPGRVLTTTVLTEGSSHRLLPVRTAKPVPKDRLMEVMYTLSRTMINHPSGWDRLLRLTSTKQGSMSLLLMNYRRKTR